MARCSARATVSRSSANEARQESEDGHQLRFAVNYLHAMDLAERLGGHVTANSLHPATYMPTKIVSAAPAGSIEQGVDATMRLVADPELAGVSGRYFNGLREAGAEAQAYHAAARERLRELSERLTA